MARTSDTLDQARSLIEQRLAELDDERKRLEGALRDLTGGRRRPGRPRGSRGRRRGTRADGALRLVKENPGITPSQIAQRMGIKPNYLYRVMSDLQDQRLVRRKGRGYFPR